MWASIRTPLAAGPPRLTSLVVQKIGTSLVIEKGDLFRCPRLPQHGDEFIGVVVYGLLQGRPVVPSYTVRVRAPREQHAGGLHAPRLDRFEQGRYAPVRCSLQFGSVRQQHLYDGG